MFHFWAKNTYFWTFFKICYLIFMEIVPDDKKKKVLEVKVFDY